MDLTIRGAILGDTIPSDILIRDGRIADVRRATGARVDIGSHNTCIIPPLFDIQVNGCHGIDLQGANLQPEHLLQMTRLLASQGVGYWVPTLITGPLDQMQRACRIMAEAMRDPPIARAVPGIHLEGPYISPMDGPRGAHPLRYVREPASREFDRLHKSAQGKILYVTLAPELKGAIPFIRHLVKLGVVAALGHHNATTDDVARAIDAGASLSTHLGNGLASSIHRHHNPLWPQLADDRLKASIIADLEHLPAQVLKVFFRAKGPENIVLVSDCVHIAGLPPGHYQLGGQQVQLLTSGRICLQGTDLLAGSSLRLLEGVLNAAQSGGATLEQAVASATGIPNRLLNAKCRFERPKVGRKAHFVAFDAPKTRGRRHVKVKLVYIDGERQDI